MIVVGLTGKAGAGKSTVADYLVEKHGFTRLSFAAPLKKMLRTLDPIMGPQVTLCGQDDVGTTRLSHLFSAQSEAEVKESPFYGAEYRRLLQVLGTDCIRAVDEDFWLRAAMKQLTDPNGRYVFDDVRFPNEAAAIRFWGDIHETGLWNIKRPGHDAGAGTHASEQHAGNMGENYFLFNSRAIDHLHEQIDFALERTAGVPA